MASTEQQQSLSNFCQRENLTGLRDEAVSNYRHRLQSGKRTKMTSDERQILIDWFIEHLKTLEKKDAIQSFCEREIALLEEGYPQNTIASDILGKYRHAIAKAIEQNHIHLTPNNSHRYTYQKRDTGEKVEAHEHYALTYLKYDSQTYQQLRNQTTDVNNQRQDNLQPVHLSSYTQQIQQLLHTPTTEANQDLKLAIAIAGATGRRHTEVLSKGTFTLTPHPYLLHFQGQQKKQKGDDTSFDILTIMPASEVMSAIERLRAIPAIAHLHGLPSSNTQVKSFNVQVNRMVIKLFQETGIVPVLPEKKYVSIHRLRGVYGAIAIHYFCPQSQHQHRFLQHYLGHTLSEQIAPNSSATPHYFHYYLVDDDHNPLTDKGILLSEFPLLDHPPDRTPPSFPPETVTTQTKTSPLSTSPSSLPLIPSKLSETLQSELEKGLSEMLNSDSYTVIMAGLMAVTGRSPGELLKSATFEPHDDDFTLLFSPTGLGAKYPLKTLIPSHLVLETRERLKNHDHVQDLLYATPNQINSHCLPYISGAIASHLPFDNLDETLDNYTQLTNNYTPYLPQVDAQSVTDSTLSKLRPVFEKLHLSGSDPEMVEELSQWIDQQLDSPVLPTQPSVDPLLAQTLSNQSQTLAWLTQRIQSLESEQNENHHRYGDSHLVQSLETKIQKLQQDNTHLKQQISQLQTHNHQLQQENQELKVISDRVEVARQALFGEQLSLAIETNTTPQKSDQTIKTNQNKTPKTQQKQTRHRNDSAVERAKTITSAILQWNQDHPDDSWAVNRGLLEKTFGINRPAAGRFLEIHSSLVTQVNQVGQVKNVRSHNRRKDPTSLQSFVNTFVKDFSGRV
ncbi:MAG: protelomerase family protein [Crocosphaera sp.]|nr:protelomerase family protein [Crocosphaera sp.]